MPFTATCSSNLFFIHVIDKAWLRMFYQLVKPSVFLGYFQMNVTRIDPLKPLQKDQKMWEPQTKSFPFIIQQKPSTHHT